ncbi:hypothetical protein D1007_51743 [Hordeum vulgare]|nr:hypothetical protein D1007_51743 [Hordeum vulgare]
MISLFGSSETIRLLETTEEFSLLNEGRRGAVGGGGDDEEWDGKVTGSKTRGVAPVAEADEDGEAGSGVGEAKTDMGEAGSADAASSTSASDTTAWSEEPSQRTLSSKSPSVWNRLSVGWSLPLHIQAIDVSPWLKLSFTKKLMLPIFTNNKLVDASKSAIEIRLIDTRTNHHITQTETIEGTSTMKLEVLVLDGDFSCEDDMEWTDDQFNAAIVKSREGRRPLLVGSTLNVVMNNQGVAVINDMAFTDNSSWIRSRKFRIGVRVIGAFYYGRRIQEAVSESFTVKDHRGELYKKHYPPLLTDNIWRLKNIGKDGPIDKRLESEGVKNVQDLLKLETIHPDKLKNVQVKQLASTAYEQWDHLEEVVVNDTELVTYEGLSPFPLEKPGSSCTIASNESIINSGSQSVEYLGKFVSRTVTSNVTMSSNNNNSLDSMVAIAASDSMYCIPSMAVDDDHFTWNNSTNLGCWDQVD